MEEIVGVTWEAVASDRKQPTTETGITNHDLHTTTANYEQGESAWLKMMTSRLEKGYR